MKKIVCFINCISNGGAEVQLSSLANMLSERGYNVSLVTYGDAKDLQVLSPQVERIRLAEGKGNVSKFFAIFKFFATTKADCVISYCQRNNFFALIPLLFRSRRKIKVIAGERNITAGDPDFYEQWLFKCLYKRADYIIPNSYTQGKYIISKRPEWKDKVQTIINYTDLDRFSVQIHDFDGTLRIGIFCRFDPQKNTVRFAEVVRCLKKSSPIPFVVDWYGLKTFKDNSPNAGYIELDELVKEYGIGDCLILKDHVIDVVSKMKEYDVLALPSLYEGFSNSIAEGISCGKPMLVSDVSDNYLMVKDGENGFLFNPTDIEEMVQKFMAFFSLSNSDRIEMGRKSRQNAEALFDKTVFLDSYIKLIES